MIDLPAIHDPGAALSQPPRARSVPRDPDRAGRTIELRVLAAARGD